jgi:tRNA(His) 5'-end guanylyltransferase
MKADLDTRMKEYERQPQGSRFMPFLPVMARLDGKAFHSFTAGLPRPYDERLSRLMVETMTFLVRETDALLGYTQSDEITLIWHSTEPGCQIFMDGKTSKMTSVLASMATAIFNRELPDRIPEKAAELAFFDCRVWTVPSRSEATNAILWRVQDAVRNSIQMAGQAQFTQEELHGKSSDEIQEMLHTKGINWNDYPRWSKEGSFVQRRNVSLPLGLTAEEIEKLPPKHHARTDPDLMVERSSLLLLDMPPFGRVTNKVDVIFEGAEPILKTERSTTCVNETVSSNACLTGPSDSTP